MLQNAIQKVFADLSFEGASEAESKKRKLTNLYNH